MNNVQHIVALSGGKDSTAMALELAEREPREYHYVCTPTGNELPEMVEHWKLLGEKLGVPLKPVTSGHSLNGLIHKWTMLPNDSARWCTRALKLEPFYRFAAQMAPAVSYVGLRADEGKRAGMDFPETGDVKIRFVMQEWGWSLSDVFDCLDRHGISIPYRTDCAWCYHQTLGEWWLLWKDHPATFWEAAETEEWVSAERGETYTFRSPQRDTWPGGLRDLAVEFDKGRIPMHRGKDPRQQGLFNLRDSMCRVCSL